MLFAPARMAAAKHSGEPTGAIISNSEFTVHNLKHVQKYNFFRIMQKKHFIISLFGLFFVPLHPIKLQCG
jgi:hypothetical protein